MAVKESNYQGMDYLLQNQLEPLLKVEDLARVFRVEPRTIQRWARENKIPHAIKCGNNRWLFPRSVLSLPLPVEPIEDGNL